VSSERPTPAEYFVLAAAKAMPPARLLIPIDRQRSQPARAELYLPAGATESMIDGYLDQARQRIGERYHAPDGGAISLYMLNVAPESEASPARFRSASAEYFTLSDENGESLASLLVPFDGQNQPLHAELYVAADLEANAVDKSISQAHQLLSDHYERTVGPDFSLTVQRVDLKDVVNIELPSGPTTPQPRNTPSSASAKDDGGKRRQRNSRLPMYVIAAIIGLGLILLLLIMTGVLNFKNLDSASTTGDATELAQTDGEDAAAADSGSESSEEPIEAQPVAEEATATPFPGPPPEIRETYCIWPGETITEIALNANVTVDAIMAVNPDFTGQAGSTILLPSGSTPPRDWTEPALVATSITDAPFGESGYYLSYDNRTKRVALSFDVGFAEGNKELMELLAERGIRATFFMLGGAVENHPEIIGEVLENGHELGNHSYTHDNMLRMTEDQVAWELSVTESLVQNAYPGATTKPLVRVPFGAINEKVINVANSQGYHIVGWTVDSADWADDVNGDIVYDRVSKLVCPGAMIAMHDVNPANAPALPRILNFLDANGYEYATVSDLLFPDK